MSTETAAAQGNEFAGIDLGGYRDILTDALLAPILSVSKHTLCTLDLSHCDLLTVASLQLLARECESLRVLRLCGLASHGDPGKITALEGRFSLISRSLRFPNLHTLDVSGSAFLTRINVDAPNLKRLLLRDAKRLVSVTTGSPELDMIDISGCSALTEEMLNQLTVRWNSLRSLGTERCPLIQHPRLRERFPWLADMGWNRFSSDVALRVLEGLSFPSASSTNPTSHRTRVLAWQNALQRIEPVLLQRLRDTHPEEPDIEGALNRAIARILDLSVYSTLPKLLALQGSADRGAANRAAAVLKEIGVGRFDSLLVALESMLAGRHIALVDQGRAILHGVAMKATTRVETSFLLTISTITSSRSPSDSGLDEADARAMHSALVEPLATDPSYSDQVAVFLYNVLTTDVARVIQYFSRNIDPTALVWQYTDSMAQYVKAIADVSMATAKNRDDWLDAFQTLEGAPKISIATELLRTLDPRAILTVVTWINAELSKQESAPAIAVEAKADQWLCVMNRIGSSFAGFMPTILSRAWADRSPERRAWAIRGFAAACIQTAFTFRIDPDSAGRLTYRAPGRIHAAERSQAEIMLVAGLSDPSELVRQTAADGVAQCDEALIARLLQSMLPLLSPSLPWEDGQSDAVLAFEALARHGDVLSRSVAQNLIGLLQREAANPAAGPRLLILRALDAMSAVSPVAAIEAFQDALDDGETIVSGMGMTGLANLGVHSRLLRYFAGAWHAEGVPLRQSPLLPAVGQLALHDNALMEFMFETLSRDEPVLRAKAIEVFACILRPESLLDSSPPFGVTIDERVDLASLPAFLNAVEEVAVEPVVLFRLEGPPGVPELPEVHWRVGAPTGHDGERPALARKFDEFID